MADTVEPTEQDLEVARQGIMIQLESRGVDVSAEGMKGFIENQVSVIAAQRAYIRFLNNCLHPR